MEHKGSFILRGLIGLVILVSFGLACCSLFLSGYGHVENPQPPSSDPTSGDRAVAVAEPESKESTEDKPAFPAGSYRLCRSEPSPPTGFPESSSCEVHAARDGLSYLVIDRKRKRWLFYSRDRNPPLGSSYSGGLPEERDLFLQMGEIPGQHVSVIVLNDMAGFLLLSKPFFPHHTVGTNWGHVEIFGPEGKSIGTQDIVRIARGLGGKNRSIFDTGMILCEGRGLLLISLSMYLFYGTMESFMVTLDLSTGAISPLEPADLGSLLRCPTQDVPSRVIRFLEQSDKPFGVDELHAEAQSELPASIRLGIIEALARHDRLTNAEKDYVLGQIEGDDGALFFQAASMLPQLFGPESVSILLRGLVRWRHETGPHVAEQRKLALGWKTNEPQPRVRFFRLYKCFKSMGLGPEQIADLLAVIEDPGSPLWIRQFCMDLIANAHRKSQTLPSGALERTVQALSAVVGFLDIADLAWVVSSVSDLHDVQGAQSVLEALLQDPREGVLFVVLDSLRMAAWGSFPEIEERILVPLMSHPDERISESAFLAGQSMRSKPVLQEMVRLLETGYSAESSYWPMFNPWDIQLLDPDKFEKGLLAAIERRHPSTWTIEPFIQAVRTNECCEKCLPDSFLRALRGNPPTVWSARNIVSSIRKAEAESGYQDPFLKGRKFKQRVHRRYYDDDLFEWYLFNLGRICTYHVYLKDLAEHVKKSSPERGAALESRFRSVFADTQRHLAHNWKMDPIYEEEE